MEQLVNTRLFRWLECRQPIEEYARDFYLYFMHEWNDDVTRTAEMYVSGSSMEVTQTPVYLIENADDAASSDWDVMYIFKNIEVGSDTPLFNALVEVPRRRVGGLAKANRAIQWLDVQLPANVPSSYAMCCDPKYRHVLAIDDTNVHSGFLRIVCTERFQQRTFLLQQLESLDKVKNAKISFNGVKTFFEDSQVYVLYKHKPITFGNINFLSGTRLKEDLLEMYNRDSFLCFEAEGPSCTADGIDYVFSLRVPYWPTEALEMIRRKSKSGLPTQEFKAKLFLKGCLVVAKPHPWSNNPDIQWRYSFSECETELCRSWNKCQLYTYKLIKILKFNYFKGLISSYFIKTTIFWAVEDVQQAFWSKENLLVSVEKILGILIGFLKAKNLPNYFARTNNMIYHYSDQQIEKIVSILQTLEQELCQKLWSCCNENVAKNVLIEDDAVFSTEKRRNLQNWWNSEWEGRAIESKIPNDDNILECLNLKFITYEDKLQRIEKSSASEDFKVYTSAVMTCSAAHLKLCTHLITGNKSEFSKAESMFTRVEFPFSPHFAKIQLALFFFVNRQYERALDHLRAVEERERYIEVAGDILGTLGDILDATDIILTPIELSLYKILSSDLDKETAWRCNAKLFAHYLEFASCVYSQQVPDALKLGAKFWACKSTIDAVKAKGTSRAEQLVASAEQLNLEVATLHELLAHDLPMLGGLSGIFLPEFKRQPDLVPEERFIAFEENFLYDLDEDFRRAFADVSRRDEDICDTIEDHAFLFNTDIQQVLEEQLYQERNVKEEEVKLTANAQDAVTAQHGLDISDDISEDFTHILETDIENVVVENECNDDGKRFFCKLF